MPSIYCVYGNNLGTSSIEIQRENDLVPATTPLTLSSWDSFSTNWRGVRYLTFENSTWYSSGTIPPQNGAHVERTLFLSHWATIGGLF